MVDLMAIPILLSPDIPTTCAFGKYIGFDVEPFGGTYAILRGYGVELHYSKTEKPEVCSETSCYIRGGGILALYDVLRAIDGINLSEIMIRSWGMCEYYLHDPHGNLIKFGMSADDISASHVHLKENAK